MITATKSARTLGIIPLYDMHSDYFIKVLDGISDEDALKRLDTKANHIAWLAGSLVQERFELAGLMGINDHQAAVDLFKNHQGIRDGIDYPSLTDYKADWRRISPLLREKLIAISDEELDKVLDFPDMGVSFPMHEMLTFNTYREANMIGQIVLWRRLLGYEAMKYD
jgi:hypothetical protein